MLRCLERFDRWLMNWLYHQHTVATSAHGELQRTNAALRRVEASLEVWEASLEDARSAEDEPSRGDV